MALVETLEYRKPQFGQLIIGPPGSGKTTYCHRIYKYLKEIGRKVAIVNLDPGNENMEYRSDINVMDLITIEDVMIHKQLGPNGSLMYALEYLESNFGWLHKQLTDSNFTYFLFDCPGQVELYTHHNSVSNIFNKLQDLGIHLCTVNLIDSHYCSEPSKFIATIMMSLSTMLKLGLPHVNVLSKADLLKEHEAKLLFNVDYYTDVFDLHYLIEALDNTPGMHKYKKLNAAIISMVEDYALVSFLLLNSNDRHSLNRLKRAIDKANGYVYGAGEEVNVNTLMACAVGSESETKRLQDDIDHYM